jgi:hypothetical protein
MAGLRFSIVGLAGFAPWVFGAGKFHSTTILYTACAIPFFALGGLALYPDVRGRLSLGKTYLLFLERSLPFQRDGVCSISACTANTVKFSVPFSERLLSAWWFVPLSHSEVVF